MKESTRKKVGNAAAYGLFALIIAGAAAIVVAGLLEIAGLI